MFNLFIVLTLFVMIQETFCYHTFVIAPIKQHENLVLRRYRRDFNNAQTSKPVMKSLHIDTVIKYRYANTVVYSKLQNPANESREIEFNAVLPEVAFISGFAITINGVVYKAYVKNKVEAMRIYQEALNAGSTAGHIEQSIRDSNTFTVSVNVEAFGKVDFNLTYEELLSRDMGVYKHKINLNLCQLVEDMKIQVVIHESASITTLIVPELRENNEISDDAIRENQNVIKEQPNSTTAIITWGPSLEQQKEVNRDGVKGLLEVRYDVDRISQPNQVLVNGGYFVHFFAPPDLTPIDKHVVFVLDRSLSMHGRKILQVKEAMSSILDELRSGDSFSILLFSSSLTLWTSDGQQLNVEDLRGVQLSQDTIVSATPNNIQAAKSFVADVRVSGLTHIYDALQTALRVVRLGRENNINKEPIIIFLTDGQPEGGNTNKEDIITDTTRANQNLSAIIYCLAFGKDADFNLLTKISLKNSGFAKKIYKASDTTLQLKHFYTKVATPELSYVTFRYYGNQVNKTSLTKVNFRIHNRGSEIAVAGKLNGEIDVYSEVTAETGMGGVYISMYPSMEVQDYSNRHPVIQNASEAGFMERLWVYLTIRQLLDLKEQSDNEEAREKALGLALAYSFVTPLTSLVVVKPNDTTSAIDLQTSYSPNLSFGADSGSSNMLESAVVPATSPRNGSSSDIYKRTGWAYLTLNRHIDTGMSHNSHSHIGPQGNGMSANIRYRPRGTTNSPTPVPGGNFKLKKRGRGRMEDHVVIPLSNYTWLEPISNDTHINILVKGVPQILKIGYNEIDARHDQCSSPVNTTSHCMHLPHCALSALSQDINEYLQYFCKIDDFIGVCCPDTALPQATTPSSQTN